MRPANPSVCCIKGNNCVATLAHAHKRLGDRYPAFVAGLPGTAREYASQRILPIDWIPIEEWHPIEVAILEQVRCGRRCDASFRWPCAWPGATARCCAGSPPSS